MEYTSEDQQNIAEQNKENRKLYKSCFWLNNLSLITSTLTAVIGLAELLLIFVMGFVTFSLSWIYFRETPYTICAFLTKTIFIANIVGLNLNIVSYIVSRKKSLRFSNGLFLFITSLLIIVKDAFLIFCSAYFIATKYQDVGYRTLSFCIVASLISLIFAALSAQKNRRYKEDAVMRTVPVIIDSLILAVGVIVSFLGTLKASKISGRFVPYFLFAVLGIALIAVLIRFIKKKYTSILGIGFVIFYLVFAGFGYIVCERNAGRFSRLRYFEGKNARLEIDGETYAWTGEGFYDSEALEPVDVSTSEAYFMTDKYNLSLDVVYVMPGEDNTIYYGFFGSETSEYLIMEKLD